MNIADMLDGLKGAHDRQMELLTRKNHDYATNADALANGKAMAAAVEALGLAPLMNTATGFYLYRALEKVHRAVNIISVGSARCEPLVDTMDDLANFASLALLAMIDEGHITPQTPEQEDKK